MAKQLIFRINDGENFPLPLSVQSLSFGNKGISLNKRKGSFLSGIRQDEAALRELSLILSQQEQVVPVDETLCFWHLGHTLLVQKGAGDYQSLWLDGICGFPPAIYLIHGLREHKLQDGKQHYILPANKGDDLKIMLPTLKVHFRPSNCWSAEVIG